MSQSDKEDKPESFQTCESDSSSNKDFVIVMMLAIGQIMTQLVKAHRHGDTQPETEMRESRYCA